MKAGITAILLSMIALCASAQSGDYGERFARFQQQAIVSHSNFREQCNREYADFLKEAWRSYSSSTVERPRRQTLPPRIFSRDTIAKSLIRIDRTIEVQPVSVQPRPVELPHVAPKDDGRTLKFVFYGDSLSVHSPHHGIPRLESCSEQGVAKLWNEISGLGFDTTLEECNAIRKYNNYCDWAFIQLVRTVSRTIEPSRNESTVLASWLLCQSGYKIRMARDGQNLHFLFASDYTIFGVSHFTIDGEKFYCQEDVGRNISIADACHFPEERGVSFAITGPMKFHHDGTRERSLHSRKYESVSVTSSVNRNLLDFMSTYPDCQYGNDFASRWAMYANTPMDEYSRQRIYPSLRSSIAGKGEVEAADILLNFVQTAFRYENDNKVWGHDRIFFAEETLYYDYCDCEDRSILFSRLVRDLLGLDVVLVYYPNHLATAVRFNETVSGDYLMMGNDRYVVCDPTYINAPVGDAMPETKGHSATLIKLRE